MPEMNEPLCRTELRVSPNRALIESDSGMVTKSALQLFVSLQDGTGRCLMLRNASDGLLDFLVCESCNSVQDQLDSGVIDCHGNVISSNNYQVHGIDALERGIGEELGEEMGGFMLKIIGDRMALKHAHVMNLRTMNNHNTGEPEMFVVHNFFRSLPVSRMSFEESVQKLSDGEKIHLVSCRELEELVYSHPELFRARLLNYINDMVHTFGSFQAYFYMDEELMSP